MNIRDLKYLIAIAEHRHFGKAAEKCFVSQPTLSMQLKKLEDELGVLLVERTNKSVLLTSVGEAVASRAREVMHHIDEIRQLSQLAKDPYSGLLKIGIFPTLAPYFLPYIMPILIKMFPKMQFHLIEQQTNDLVKSLKKGELDTVILALPVVDETLMSVPLFVEEFLLAVPQSHSLAKRKTITEIDLKNQHILLLEDGHCLRDQALSFCHTMNIAEDINFRATSLETLRHMVMAGIGITIMPKLACNKNDDLVYIPFSPAKYSRSVALLWRNSTAKEILLNEIANHVNKIMKTI